MKIKPFIGMPVYQIGDKNKPNPWVGWIRRINWDDELLEVLPENRLGDHIGIYKFDGVCPGKFTKRMHSELPAHIAKLQTWIKDDRNREKK